jgi:ABC-type hemin transport system ATPase subunit
LPPSSIDNGLTNTLGLRATITSALDVRAVSRDQAFSMGSASGMPLAKISSTSHGPRRGTARGSHLGAGRVLAVDHQITSADLTSDGQRHSGGNQQKVVFAKWLEADPSVILLDDPSRGVDVGAKEEMHAIIAQMAASKKVILYTSSDLEEMAHICDRVVVFFGGRVVGEIDRDQLSESVLMEAINVGGVPADEELATAPASDSPTDPYLTRR